MKMKESKTTMISIKYTQQDKEYLLAEAQKAGCSLSEYIRENPYKVMQFCSKSTIRFFTVNCADIT